MKKLCVLLCVLVCFAAQPLSFAKKNSNTTLKAGDFVRLGNYLGEPVLWQAVSDDENGLLLLCQSILDYRPFDSSVSRWDKSSLRLWLNDEKDGFLNGFTDGERALIQAANVKSVLNQVFSADADAGTEAHLYHSSGQYSNIVQNYDIAYTVTTRDMVFCPGIDQLEAIINYFGDLTASPTQSALKRLSGSRPADTSRGYYWLRDGLGNAEFTDSARCVFPDGRILFSDIDNADIGVRPALYIKKQIPAAGGLGSKEAPYYITQKITSSFTAAEKADTGSGKSLAGAYSTIAEGDYFKMGSYNGKDILWRCAAVTDEGPLMLSEYILSFKAFDAAGSHGNEDRDKSGSNYWINSNIRFWLNSADSPVSNWPCGNAPADQSTGGCNGYDQEDGFLAGFSPEEQTNIKAVPVKTVISSADAENAEGGQALQEFFRNAKDIGNYDDAYCVYTQDKIFLLGLKDVKLIKDRFPKLLAASPTPEAVAADGSGSNDIAANIPALWWLRDADADAPAKVRAITADCWVHSLSANKPSVGIRPAFYLDMDTANFVEGDGSLQNPYCVGSHCFAEWELITPPACESEGLRQRICSVCGETQTEQVSSLGHNFGKGAILRTGIFSSRIRQYECKNCGLIYTQTWPPLWPGLCALAAAAAVAAVWLLKKRKDDKNGTK